MIAVLLTAKLTQQAEQRTSKAGKPFWTARATASTAEGESLWVSLVAFNEAAGHTLAHVAAGDVVAITGTVKPKAYTTKSGEPAASLDVIVERAMSLYQLGQRRKSAAKPAPVAEFDDALDMEVGHGTR